MRKTPPLKIVVVAAHPDDEALGVGGALLRFKEMGHEIHLLFLCDGITSRNIENKIIKKRFYNFKKAMDFLKPTSYKVLEYPDNKLDSVPLLEIVKEIESFLIVTKPDILFMHFINDLNVDHRIAAQASITASRSGSNTFVRKILSFEVLSSTGCNLGATVFAPNYFIDITKFIDDKIEYLKFYEDEMRAYPHARSIENIRALSQLRGSEVFASNAEGFILMRNLENEH